MHCFARSAGFISVAGTRLAPLLVLAVAVSGGCSSHKLSSADAQRLIESSPRFTDPDVLRVRQRYCSTVDAPSDNPAAGLGRLKALEGAGAIRIDRRAAGPGDCVSTPGPMREWLVLSLTDTGNGFHPRPLPNAGGWEFTLATRRFVALQELTVNNDDEPTVARVLYRWAWRSELLGQLMQVSEDPVNAQATFFRRDDQWELRDVGF